jgi:hypothetical protein
MPVLVPAGTVNAPRYEGTASLCSMAERGGLGASAASLTEVIPRVAQ